MKNNSKLDFVMMMITLGSMILVLAVLSGHFDVTFLYDLKHLVK